MFRESIIMAWGSLIANKLRTILTMLGIIIGVAAVIALVSVGYGVRHQIESNLSSLGSNLLIVSPNWSHRPGVRSAPGAIKQLTVQDFYALEHIPNIEAASPMVQRQFETVYKNNNWTTVISGVNSQYKKVSGREIVEGRFITKEQVLRRERVAVIGQKVKEHLFGEVNPIGKNIRINNQSFKVIGTLDKKGSSGFGMDEDDLILVPYTTYMERITGQTHIGTIMLIGKKKTELKPLEIDILNVLRLRHHSKPGDEAFQIDNMASLLKKVEETTGTLTLFLGAIAMISLLVGGIGIMNIMLVSVTERTREIGIRKALGATSNTIITQFLIEAIFISFCGGCIGVFIGICSSKIIALVIDMETIISFSTIAMSFAFAMTVGLIFGIYPAQKAAKLNPIDALHYE